MKLKESKSLSFSLLIQARKKKVEKHVILALTRYLYLSNSVLVLYAYKKYSGAWPFWKSVLRLKILAQQKVQKTIIVW